MRLHFSAKPAHQHPEIVGSRVAVPSPKGNRRRATVHILDDHAVPLKPQDPPRRTAQNKDVANVQSLHETLVQPADPRRPFLKVDVIVLNVRDRAA